MTRLVIADIPKNGKTGTIKVIDVWRKNRKLVIYGKVAKVVK